VSPDATAAVAVVAGTRLATATGPVAAEDLTIGTRLAGPDGTGRALRWAGRTVLFPDHLAAHPALCPVCVRQGALADGVPTADIAVAPQQPVVLADGTAVPAVLLVNGRSVLPRSAAMPADYLSLVLDAPGPVLAAGAALLPIAATEPSAAEQRRRLAGRALVATRAGLAAGPLRGALDGADHRVIRGWAFDPACPDLAVAIEILVDDTCIHAMLAERPRPDLAAAGIGDGRHGFRFDLPEPLDPTRPHFVRVCRIGAPGEVPGSPVLIDARSDLATILAACDPADPAARRDALRAVFVQLRERLENQAPGDHAAGDQAAGRVAATASPASSLGTSAAGRGGEKK
jgi:hypothetical protein